MSTTNASISRRNFIASLGLAAGALGVAGLSSQNAYAAETESPEESTINPDDVATTVDTDLLIVGLGGSGLACAVQAGLDGVNTVVVEQMPVSGGNALGVEGMFAINSSMQKELGLAEITAADIISAQMQVLQYRPNGADWVEYCEKSGENIDWCLEQGVEYEGNVDNYYTGDFDTFHWFKGGSCGTGYVPQMTAKLDTLDSVQVFYNTTAEELIRDADGAIAGIYATGEDGLMQINAKAIVLATGGFGSNPEVIEKQGWDITDLICIGACGTGAGYLMGVKAGACDDISNSCQSIVPVVAAFPKTDYAHDAYNPINGYAGVACNPAALWVDQNADRFVREDVGTQMPFSSSCLSTRRNKATYIVFDQAIYDATMGVTPEAREMFDSSMESDKGHSLYASENLEDLANHFELDPEQFQKTIDRYNAYCEAGVDGDFSKDPASLIPIAQPPYYIARMTFSYYFSVGGLMVDKFQRVWDDNRDPIPGLYACGDDGNNHYASLYTINIPGTAFGHQVNSGRKAAQSAKAYIESL